MNYIMNYKKELTHVYFYFIFHHYMIKFDKGVCYL